MAHVTVPERSPRIQYTVTTPADATFDFDWTFYELTDIVVVVTDAAGVDTTYTHGAGMTVSGTSVGSFYSDGTVTLDAAVTNSTVTVYADFPIERTTDFPTSGLFPINDLNTQIDRIFSILQQLDLDIGRKLGVDIVSSCSSLVLPDGSEGKVLKWKADTCSFENSIYDPDETRLLVSGESLVYDIAAFFEGQLADAASAPMWTFLASRSFDLNATGASISVDDWKAYAGTAPSGASVDIDIQKNGVSIGTLSFADGVNTGTWTFASDVSFVAGDRLTFQTPASVAGMENISWNIRAERI